MVHSGSAFPMTTPPSASPHLTIPATAPPLPTPPPPLAPPAAGTEHHNQSQTPAKGVAQDLSVTPDLSIAPTPALTPTRDPNSCSGPASAQPPAKTPDLLHDSVNGRTSGRKRTPKACDCCGPHGRGHNANVSTRGGRGRGTPRGRGRGFGRPFGDTPKRIVDPLAPINHFELTEEAEGHDDGYTHVQTTVPVDAAEAPSQNPADLPAAGSPEDGPLKNCVAPDRVGLQRRVMMVQHHLRGRGGNELMGDASKHYMRLGVRRGGGCGGPVGLETDPRVGSMSMLSHVPELQCVYPHPFGNGDLLSPPGVRTVGEGRGDCMAALSVSVQSEAPMDLDLDPQVDPIPDGTDSVSISVTLCNGSASALTGRDHTSTPMEQDGARPALPSPPPQGPISVCTAPHQWALRDHRLYCHLETWEGGQRQQQEEKEEGGEEGRWRKEQDGQGMQEEDSEWLVEMIHEFLESFYIKYGSFIPLSERDVLDHLKKKANYDLNKSGLDVAGVMGRYRASLASAPVAGFVLMYNRHSLSLEDLGTLEEHNWLNDQVINMYGELIMEATQHRVHFFNSFFHKQLVAKGYEGVKRWTKKVDLFSKWLLLIPIHLEIHWSLITVTIANKAICYYDSQGITIRHTIDNIMKYLQSEAREKKQTAHQKGWKMHVIKGIPQQKNDSDCGVFVLEYCRRLSVEQPLQFSQEDMPDIRKRIYKELCDRGLNN
ncbi:uncharacterized protein LOC143001607 [Genypterus blacodes]|uniref:uncharacterized protein LOC143001607 n=1 Tax=Genypterus blacodes TaxID=154954 RepID=UPI003F76AFB7